MHYNSQSTNDIHVMHWNCQGITTYSAIAQLELFVREKNIDVILLNETFLKPTHKFKINGFKIYRKDRLSHGGGVLIGIKNNIKHVLLPVEQTIDIESLSISIDMNGRTTCLTTAYNPQYTSNFNNDIELLTNKRNDFFIFGDFNALHSTWNCHSENSAGKALFNIQNKSRFYIYYSPNPTRFSQNFLPAVPSTIDLLLSNSSLHFSNLETHPNCLSSDHVPMTCHIYGSIRCHPSKILLYHKADWISIRRWVTNQISSINITANNFKQCLNSLVDIVKGVSNKIPYVIKRSFETELSPISLHLIRQRKMFQRKFHRCADPNLRRSYSAILKQLRKLINFHIDRDRNKNWSKFISTLPSGSKKFWKISKFIKGKHTAIPQLVVNGTIFITPEEKSDKIAEVFEKAHTTTLNFHSPMTQKVNKINKQVDSSHIEVMDDSTLTNGKELVEICSRFRNNKSPGFDNIPNIVLKNMPAEFFEILSQVFNFYIKNGVFPKIFKKAKVIPVLKKGKDPKLPSSYRPISLLSCLDKLFEYVLYRQIMAFAERYNIIHSKQFGFRKEHSTVHQIKRVVNIIETNKASRLSTGAVLLDVEKAFDSIWHDGLIYKLNLLSFPIYIQKIIKSFLESRTFSVCIENISSITRNIPAGLPQGSVLSPLLYSIYTSDIDVKKNHDAAFYADDSMIICKGKLSNAIVKQLSDSLKRTVKYFKKWKIKINNEKTQAIIFPFNKSPKRVPSIDLNMDGNIIEIKKSILYLGIILDSKLSFRENIERLREKATRCGKALYPLLNRRSKLNIKNKKLLYKSCIRPIMTYACQVWYKKTARCHIKKLQIIQNKNLKIIHNLNWRFPTTTLHAQYGHDSIETVLRSQTLSFEERCRRSNYDILRNLV